MVTRMLQGLGSGERDRRHRTTAVSATDGARSPMKVEVRTYRLAIGLFSEHPPLFRALDDLSDQGLNRECLCLIGRSERLKPRTFDGVDHGAFSRSGHLFEGARDVDGLFPPARCAASGGPLFDDLCAPIPFPLAEHERYPMWLTRNQYDRLHGHVQEGGFILIVSSATPTQQDASSRILLRHSQNGVQTHDFTVRSNSASAC